MATASAPGSKIGGAAVIGIPTREFKRGRGIRRPPLSNVSDTDGVRPLQARVTWWAILYVSYMSIRKTVVCVLFLAVVAVVAILADQTGLFTALKTNASLGWHEEGFYLLPTNQVIRPAGDESMISGRPVDMAFDSQKHLLAILNWRSVMLLDAAGNKVAEIPSRSTSYLGVAFRPGDRELWASE